MNRTQLSGINIAACSSSAWLVICWVNSAAESWSLSVHPAKCGLWNPPLLPFILSGMKGRWGQSPQHLKADYIRSLLCGGQRGRASGVGWEAAGLTRGVTTEESRKWWGAGTRLHMQICVGRGLRRYPEMNVIWNLARRNLSLLWCWLVCTVVFFHVSNNSRVDCWEYHNNCSCTVQNLSVFSVVILLSVDFIIVVCSRFREVSSFWDILVFLDNIFF